jgi:AcrR family transcriptional regulator
MFMFNANMTPPPTRPLPDPPERARAPLQQRSREKFEAILSATEGLLEKHWFEEVTMQNIATQARVAVGTIYTRFPTKEDLLPVLFERHHEQVGPQLQKLLRTLAQGKHLSDRLAQLVGFSVRYHSRRRGLLRALTHYVRQHAEVIPQSVFEARQKQYAEVAAALLAPPVKTTPTLLARLSFAMAVINATCREQLLFAEITPHRGGPTTSSRVVQQRLTQMVQLYVECGADSPASPTTP